MLGNLKTATLLVVAGAVLSSAGPAHADQANINSISFNTQSAFNQVIHVVSSDKKKWDKLKSGSVQFWGHMQLDTKWPGYVSDVGVVLGSCGSNTCISYPTLFAQQNVNQRDYNHQRNFAVPAGKIPVSTGGGIALVPYGDQMIARCNQHLAANGPTKTYSFDFLMQATFVAETGKIANMNDVLSEVIGPDGPTLGNVHYSKTGSFTVKVVCDPVIVSPVGGYVAKEPDFKVTSIELFRTTFSGATSQPNPGTVCKKAELKVRLKTSKAGPVKFKLWTKIGASPMTSKVIDAWSAFSGGGFKAEYKEWVSVSKTSLVKAMAEDMTNPIGQSTGWKDITLHCTGAGGGGLADKPNPNDDGPLVAPLKVTGELTLADSAANSNKPRLGQAVFKIWATKPGNMSYKLTCSGNRKWEGTLPTFKVANKKYQAVGAVNFQIAKTEQIGCALRSTSLPNNGVIALASKLFKLVNRNPNVSGPGGVTGKPQPTSGKPKRPLIKVAPKPKRPLIKVAPKPKRPLIKVAPVRKIACIGGKVSRNSCFCPARTKKVKIGANAYRCIVNVVKPIAPPKRVIMTAPVRQSAPVKRVAPAGNQRRFGKTR
jgi:hypothetical protein